MENLKKSNSGGLFFREKSVKSAGKKGDKKPSHGKPHDEGTEQSGFPHLFSHYFTKNARQPSQKSVFSRCFFGFFREKMDEKNLSTFSRKGNSQHVKENSQAVRTFQKIVNGL